MKRNYLIIGGSSGIAHSLVSQLLADGHQLHVALRHPDQLDAAVSSKQHFDANQLAPLKLPESLDGLIYAPGSITLKPFHRLTQEDFLQELQVNLLGAVYVLQQALPALKKGNSPSVVLFSTVAVQTGMPFHASISAAKGAIEGLTRALAAEWAPLIRVNAIAPSLTDTPLAGALLNTDDKRLAATKRHPLQSIGNPEDLASLAKFLLSPQMRFMSGQILQADGGLGSLRVF